jgi:aspartate oxidase
MSELFSGFVFFSVVLGGQALSLLAKAFNNILDLACTPLGSTFSMQSVLEEWYEKLREVHKSYANSHLDNELKMAFTLEEALRNFPIYDTIVKSNEDLREKFITAKEMLYSTDKSYYEAREILEEVVDSAQSILSNAYRNAISQSLKDSLSELNYKIEECKDDSATAIWATKGDKAMAVIMDDKGNIQIDMKGFEGLSCQEEKQKLISLLEDKGVIFKQVSGLVHRRKEGGQLIQKVLKISKKNRLSLSQALLKTAQERKTSERDRQRIWGALFNYLSAKEVI